MIKVAKNIEELFNFAAEQFIEIANNSIEQRGRFTVALAGGSTPKQLYKLLSTKKLAWKKVVFFFGDERNVPIDSVESNYKMADTTLFKPLNINQNNIYRWQTELETPIKVAQDYAEKVNKFAPIFDLVLLGMGNDGHTASLFPYSMALGESEKIAVENWVEQHNSWRFTLTFKAINNARNIIFIVNGEDKAQVLREVLEGEYHPETLPSQIVKPENGKLLWLLDENVAKLLSTYGN
jgi:6-phosphogluconolactonase